MGLEPNGANLVPGLMPRRSAGAPDPYRGSAICEVSLGLFEVLLRAATPTLGPAKTGHALLGTREEVCMSLDQVTKQQLQQKLTSLKPQLKREFPELSDSDISQAERDPEQFIRRIEEKSGQPREQVEQRLTQLVGGRS